MPGKIKFNFKDPLTVGLSATGVGVSTANYLNNSKKRKSDSKFQEKQLEAINNLTKSLDKFDDTISKYPPPTRERIIFREAEPKKKKRFRFFQKENSRTMDYALAGAGIGGGLAGLAMHGLPDKIGMNRKYRDGKPYYEDIPDYKYPEMKNKYNKVEPFFRNALLELGGIAIGAALGAIAGAAMDLSQAINRKTTINNRLMRDILDNLQKSGFKEGKDYTRDPKMSNLLKTKVCIVISKSSDTLKLLINTVNDRKLNSVNKEITKNLPGMSTVTEKVADKFNELNITTLTTNNGDAVWIASVAERFIKSGYPVYLVEVG